MASMTDAGVEASLGGRGGLDEKREVFQATPLWRKREKDLMHTFPDHLKRPREQKSRSARTRFRSKPTSLPFMALLLEGRVAAPPQSLFYSSSSHRHPRLTPRSEASLVEESDSGGSGRCFVSGSPPRSPSLEPRSDRLPIGVLLSDGRACIAGLGCSLPDRQGKDFAATARSWPLWRERDVRTIF